MLKAPVISEKAKQALEPLIGHHCEILPLIELRNKPYYAVNVLTAVDCLDHKKSEIRYLVSEPNTIAAIDKVYFHENKIPKAVPIFKIPEYVSSVYVTKSFIDAVIANGLRGAQFLDPASNQLGKIIRGIPLNVIPGLPE